MHGTGVHRDVADSGGTWVPSPELFRRIRRLHFRTNRTVDTLMAGSYRSAFRGTGIEFEEVREYSPGDDVGSIDWNVTARMGRPFVKLYREERELMVYLLVDLSASGLFGTGGRDGTGTTRRERIAETAALLAFAATKSNDRVGAILFSDRIERHIPPKKGTSHVWRVIRDILGTRPAGRRTDIAEALGFLGSAAKRRSVAFVLSDFIAPDFSTALKVAARRHDLIGVEVRDPGEEIGPPAGLVRCRDPETGRERLIDFGSERVRREWIDHARERKKRLEDLFRTAGVDRIEISTRGSVVDPLARFFRDRELRYR